MRLRTPLVVLSLLVGSSSAWAQDTTTNSPITLTMTSGYKSAFNRSECLANTQLSVTYQVNSSFLSGAYSSVKILLYLTPKATCTADPADGDTSLVEETAVTASNQAAPAAFEVSKLLSDCLANTTKTYRACAVVKSTPISSYGTTSTASTDIASLSIQYDSAPPKAPSIAAITPGDQKLTVTWDGQDDIETWTVYYRKTLNGPPPDAGDDICGTLDPLDAGTAGGTGGAGEPDAGPDDAGTPVPDTGAPDTGPAIVPFDSTGYTKGFSTEDGTATEGEVRNLMNNQEYKLVLVATDIAGNVSPDPGTDTLGTPFVVQDFYRRYRCAGGSEAGGFGCSTAGMIAIPGAAFAMLALLRRRRGA